MAIPTAFHPSEYIKEEMEARGWSRDRLATEMAGDYDADPNEWGITRLALDMFFEVGPIDRNARIGDVMAGQLGKAFGVSKELFLNLEQSWLKSLPPVS